MSGSRELNFIKRGTLEFLVIVIGILSAFWVEEFRESRRLVADEAAYLTRIAADLDGAAAAMEAGIQWVDARRMAGRAVLSFLEEGTSELAGSELLRAAFDVTLVPVSAQRRLGDRSTYDELLATGTLMVLQDQSLRDELARYYLEYDRVGGRLLQIPEEWGLRNAGLLSPDLAELLQARSSSACSIRVTTPATACDVPVGSADEQRFIRGLTADREEAWRDLTRLVQYQDRQAADLRGFQSVTEELRSLIER